MCSYLLSYIRFISQYLLFILYHHLLFHHAIQYSTTLHIPHLMCPPASVWRARRWTRHAHSARLLSAMNGTATGSSGVCTKTYRVNVDSCIVCRALWYRYKLMLIDEFKPNAIKIVIYRYLSSQDSCHHVLTYPDSLLQSAPCAERFSELLCTSQCLRSGMMATTPASPSSSRIRWRCTVRLMMTARRLSGAK